MYEGTLSLSDSDLTENEAEANGGAVYIYTGVVEASGSTVSNNKTGGNGGGLYQYEGNLFVKDSVITENEAGGHGGGASMMTGTLESVSSDWGTDGTDNAPDDVSVAGSRSSAYGEDASFVCSPDGCE